MRLETLADRDDLVRRLPLPEDDLRVTLPKRPVRINCRDADLLDRRGIELPERRIDGELPGGYLDRKSVV